MLVDVARRRERESSVGLKSGTRRSRLPASGYIFVSLGGRPMQACAVPGHKALISWAATLALLHREPSAWPQRNADVLRPTLDNGHLSAALHRHGNVHTILNIAFRLNRSKTQRSVRSVRPPKQLETDTHLKKAYPPGPRCAFSSGERYQQPASFPSIAHHKRGPIAVHNLPTRMADAVAGGRTSIDSPPTARTALNGAVPSTGRSGSSPILSC